MLTHKEIGKQVTGINLIEKRSARKLGEGMELTKRRKNSPSLNPNGHSLGGGGGQGLFSVLVSEGDKGKTPGWMNYHSCFHERKMRPGSIHISRHTHILIP